MKSTPTVAQLRRLDKAIVAQMRTYAQCRRRLTDLDPATVTLGIEVFRSEAALVQWLCAPAFALAGRIPLKTMRSAKGRGKVTEMLRAIQYGVFL